VRCPHGYEVADSSGRTSGGVGYTIGHVTAVSTSYSGEMLVRCKQRQAAPKPATEPGPGPENGWEPEDEDDDQDAGATSRPP